MYLNLICHIISLLTLESNVNVYIKKGNRKILKRYAFLWGWRCSLIAVSQGFLFGFKIGKKKINRAQIGARGEPGHLIPSEMTTTVKPSTSADMDNSPNSANGMENELSKLVVGAYKDLSTLSLDEPAGETADWIVITTALAQMDANFLVKVAYMLTTRGQEQKNSHKGTRIMYREGADKKLWISFGTDSSSMLKTEITPGRFRTAVAGLVFVHPQLRISPVMSVIGLEVLIKQWETTSGTITAKINANDVSFPDNGVKMIDGGDTVSFSDINFPKIYALAPDRVPPHYAHVSGALELGAALALCQDMRNIILASIEQGTAAQKNRQRSEFHRSFTRRSAAMGYMVNPDIWPYICAEVITLCAANFLYRSQLDDKTRQFAQKIIDNAVQAMSKNALEKI